MTSTPIIPKAGPLDGEGEQSRPIVLPHVGRRLRDFLRNRAGMVGLVFIGIVVVCAVFAQWIAPDNPAATNLNSIFHGPTVSHLLGTDELGRDVLSRLIFAARVSLLAGTFTVLTTLVISLPLGLVSGYFGGIIDSLFMRGIDAVLAIPALILFFAIAGILGPGLVNVIIALSVVFAPGMIRIVRNEVRNIVQSPLVEAEVAMGLRSGGIICRHVLPNISSPIIVQSALTFAGAILGESSLSFLGIGVVPPTVSWGTMLRTNFQYIVRQPWGVVVTGAAVALTVLAVNLVADALRDALLRPG